nr:uncharacterized mitochondrial protein AtMg00810-like [Tanacetum cinerariifolium]
MIIALKWIYKVKHDEYDDVLKNKARLVEKDIDKRRAPREWYDTMSRFLLDNKFSKGAVDPTLFTQKTSKHILQVQIYVDDTAMALTAYADADHAGCQDTRRSTSGSA